MSRNNDYPTGNLLEFSYFKKNYSLIATDLGKQTKLKDTQKINFIVRQGNNNNGARKHHQTTFNFLQNFVNIL